MSKLAGKIVYIAGGAGNVGEGIVRGFLKAGATVVTSSRSNNKLDRLRELLNIELANERTRERANIDSFVTRDVKH